MGKVKESDIMKLMKKQGISDPESAIKFFKQAFREEQRQAETELFEKIHSMCKEEGVSTSRLITHFRKLRASESADPTTHEHASSDHSTDFEDEDQQVSSEAPH